jgi:hypothetical protein
VARGHTVQSKRTFWPDHGLNRCMKLRRAHLVLAAFGLFLLSLILLADSGRGQELFLLAGRIPAGDKVGHLVLFGFLSFLVNLIAGAVTTRLFGRTVLKWSAMLLAGATLEECSQLFFRSRSFDLLDLVAGAVGIWLFGRAAVHYLRWKRTRKAALAEASSKI